MATAKHAAAPSVMRAVRIAQYGGSDQLRYEEAPLPQIGPGQVLAKVRYAGVNPIDWKIREGYKKDVRQVSFPLTLGGDFAGEIVACSGDSGSFRTGERVFGFGEGTYAEFTAAAITDIAPIPEKMEFAVAARGVRHAPLRGSARGLFPGFLRGLFRDLCRASGTARPSFAAG